MAFTQQSLTPHPFNRHLMRQKAKSKKARRTMASSLMLTPMVDMFSLLVIFLLQFFSSSPEFLITPGMQLPNSVSGVEMKLDVPMVTLTLQDVIVDRKKVGTIEQLLANPEPLVHELSSVRDAWKKKHASEPPISEVNLEADENLKSTIVAKYMAILSAQHWSAIQLLTFNDAG